MRSAPTVLFVALLVSACSVEQFPVLHPDWAEGAPAWAKIRCGPHPKMCAPDSCCGQDYECSGSDPNVLPMYRQPGHCNYYGRGL